MALLRLHRLAEAVATAVPPLLALLVLAPVAAPSSVVHGAYLQGPEAPVSLTFRVEISLLDEGFRELGRASVSVFMDKRGDTWRASYVILSSNLERGAVGSILRGLFNYEVAGEGAPGGQGAVVYVSLGEGRIYKCSLEELRFVRVESSVGLGGPPLTLSGVAAVVEEGIPVLVEMTGRDPLGGYVLEARAPLSSSTLPLCGKPVASQVFNALGLLSLLLALMALASVFWRHRVYREVEASYYY
jgi:hypothetical protein